MFSFIGRLFKRVGPGEREPPPPAPPPSASTAREQYQRANALRSAGRLAEALDGYDAAIALDPGYAHAYCNRGVVLQALGQPIAALASFDRALALAPHDAMAHYNRALLLQQALRWDEALESYERAVAADPDFADARYNRALALLYCGDYALGWREFEWRWKNARRLSIGGHRSYAQPLWLGEEPLAGKRILLRDEGGFGDTLQFCRYASLLAARGATVLLEVQAPLTSLLARMPGVAAVFPAGSALPPFDYQCPLMSLPLACATTLATVPGPVPYLQADASLIGAWQQRLGPRPRIGIVWSGNPDNWIDAQRTIRLADWAPQLPPEFTYYRLQKDVRDADRVTLASMPNLVSFDDAFPDFDSTAALCACMDLIVSVDTSVLHLAGALGRPALALLAASPDWRWRRERADTPWYPTLKLLRQQTPGDWRPVFARVAAELRGFDYASRAAP